MYMEDIERIKKILELRANYQKLGTCTICGANTDSTYFHNPNDKVGQLLCKTCNEVQVSEDEVKGNFQLEYLLRRANKQA